MGVGTILAVKHVEIRSLLHEYRSRAMGHVPPQPPPLPPEGGKRRRSDINPGGSLEELFVTDDRLQPAPVTVLVLPGVSPMKVQPLEVGEVLVCCPGCGVSHMFSVATPVQRVRPRRRRARPIRRHIDASALLETVQAAGTHRRGMRLAGRRLLGGRRRNPCGAMI